MPASGLLLAPALAAQDVEPVVSSEPDGESVSGEEALPAVETAPESFSYVIPKLTPVEIEVLDTVGSATSKGGDTFRIRLAYPIIQDGLILVPAGAEGMGEVVHAKKRGGSGAGGELILAARYVMVDGREMRLRSTELSAKGLDQTEKAMAVGVAVGIFGMAVKGRDVEVLPGRIADAKLAQDFEIVLAEAPAQAPKQAQIALPATTDEAEPAVSE